MAQGVWLTVGLIAAALTAPPVWAGTPAREGDAALLRIADRDDRIDYERGFTDGLKARDDRDRDGDYRTGYRAGRAKREANEAEGRDYARGYIAGYERYRQRSAVPSKNRAYAAGYRAGQADHTAMVIGTPQRPLPPTANLPRPTRVQDMVGRPSSMVDEDMKSLGYRSLGRLKQAGETFSLWRGSSDSDCFRLALERSRVKAVAKIPETECR